MTFWTTLTEPQATIIAAVLTIVAAGVGVFFGSWLFGNKVSDLKLALAQAEDQLTSYRGQFEETIKTMGDTIDVQVQAIQQSLGQIGTAIEDVRASTTDEPVEQPAAIGENGPDLREIWTKLRDRLEGIASSAEIDGRTRAKYTRIDRRRYRDFIHALDSDGRLGDDADSYYDALEIWQRNRSGRRPPSQADLDHMSSIALAVLK